MSINRWPRRLFQLLFRFLPLCLVILALGVAWPAVDSLRVSAESLECYCPSCPADLLPEAGINRLGLIKVDVAGAVVRPGIYQLDLGSRQADLLLLAGGLTADASQVFLAKTFNLSAELADGDKIYFPYTWEEEWQLTLKSNVGSSTESTTESSTDTPNNSLISINQAGASQLEDLPGIGEKRAKDIIAGRPYSNLNDLTNLDILSQSIFDEIKVLISL